MARRVNKHLRPFRPLRTTASGEQRSEGRFIVRTVSGANAMKVYRCPGCFQPISPGTPHLVVWPAEPALARPGTVEERRHWHTGCWRSAARR